MYIYIYISYRNYTKLTNLLLKVSKILKLSHHSNTLSLDKV